MATTSKQNRILSCILACLAGGLSTIALAEQAAPTSVPLKVVGRQEFCSRLTQRFASYGAASGYSKVESALLANGGAVGVTQEFRAGRATDFINAAALAEYSSVPVKAPSDGFLPIAGFVGEAMGLTGDVTMALSAAELRFIPFAQRGLDLVVVAQNATTLTPGRMQKVAEAARSMGIKIHVVWVGPTDDDGKDLSAATPLAWIAAMTGGSIANLGGRSNPCAPAI